jgi:hypothetical protein
MDTPIQVMLILTLLEVTQILPDMALLKTHIPYVIQRTQDLIIPTIKLARVTLILTIHKLALETIRALLGILITVSEFPNLPVKMIQLIRNLTVPNVIPVTLMIPITGLVIQVILILTMAKMIRVILVLTILIKVTIVLNNMIIQTIMVEVLKALLVTPGIITNKANRITLVLNTIRVTQETVKIIQTTRI